MQSNDYDKAIKLLKKGISAIKFNFSTMGTQQVILSLSADEKSIIYKSKEKTIKSYFSIARTYPVEKIASFLYGGATATFKKHNKAVLGLIQKLNAEKVNFSQRDTKRKHSLRIKES